MVSFLNVNIYIAKKDREKQELKEFYDEQKEEFMKPYLQELERKQDEKKIASKEKKRARNQRSYLKSKTNVNVAADPLAVHMAQVADMLIEEFSSTEEEFSSETEDESTSLEVEAEIVESMDVY